MCACESGFVCSRCVSAKWTRAEARVEAAEQAVRPFAERANWKPNYDGQGIVYVGPGSNSIHLHDVADTARAALTRSGGDER